MDAIPICLAVFATAGARSARSANPRTIAAIERFVAVGPQEPGATIARLRQLSDAYAALKMDGAIALAITSALERRIAQILGEAPTSKAEPA